ncbi:MAG: DUF2914 domain-containing protein [Fodinibius sp.]|nr:DUF2914 domain-containing protein [Fodinibius sp.]
MVRQRYRAVEYDRYHFVRSYWGRQRGYRGYTFKESIWPGRWHVNVTTGEGLVLGRIDFTVIADTTFNRANITRQKF